MTRGIVGELYRTDRDGVILDDLSRLVVSGSVEYNAERSGGTPLTGEFTLSQADALEPMRDFVSPFLSLTDEDGTVQRQRMGVYRVALPRETHTRTTAQPTYQLRDLTDLLALGGSTEPRVVASGTNITTALTDLAALAGLTRVAFPNSTRTTGYKRTYPAGTTWLEQSNRLCEAFGWYPEWMGLDGKLTTRPQQLLSETTPIATLTTDDPTDTISIEPTNQADLANIVVVTRDRGDQEPLEGSWRNDDPASETSTVNIGPIVYGGGPYEAVDAETQQDIDAIVNRLADQCRSYDRTVVLKIPPRFDVLGMWRTLDLEIETVAGANLRGRYWIRGWRAGFTPADAAMTLTLGRLVRFNRGEDR